MTEIQSEHVDSSGSAEPSPSRIDIEAALERIVHSQTFDGAARLSELLTYIVNQHLANPSKKLPAKTIAFDVYKREPDPGSNSENIVRVDAGRLRRRLKEYYAGPGKNDGLRILIETGGYTPTFKYPKSENSPDDPDSQARLASSRTLTYVGVALLVGIALGSAIGYGLQRRPAETSPATVSRTGQSSGSSEVERKALMAKSPASLQAFTLSEQARDLIFPMFELEQLKLTLAMFRQAIRKDSSYFGGYAGAAQSLATLSIFPPDGAAQKQFLSEAKEMAEHANALVPTEAWVQSALAWVSYAAGDLHAAKQHAGIALELAPKDGHVLDFHALLMLCMGDFVAARDAADPNRERSGTPGQQANRGFYGAAIFHLSRYEEAISSLLAAS